MATGVYLFRKDFRLSDNPLLAQACGACSSLVLLVLLDREQWLDPHSHATCMSWRRQFFIYQSIQDLARTTENRGGRLTIRFGKSLEVLNDLAKSIQIDRLYLEDLPGTEEEAVKTEIERFCLTKKIEFTSYWQRTLVCLEDMPMHWTKLPKIFTTFRLAVEKEWRVRTPVEITEWPEIISLPSEPWPIHLQQVLPSDERSRIVFNGGSNPGKERLHYYCSHPSLLGQYKETRNGLVGADYSSKFSPWLAWGCISPREVYAAVLDYEAQFGENQSSYWMKFELLWRDFFQFTAKLYGKSIFMRNGFSEVKRPATEKNLRGLEMWCAGQTGQPFVDACIQELIATGFLSNRGRQNAASFLVHDLMVDWRAGARFFEYHLLDYDVASNWCNWAYVAGVGNDPRAGRKFNVDKQAKDYDPNSLFRKLWTR